MTKNEKGNVIFEEYMEVFEKVLEAHHSLKNSLQRMKKRIEKKSKDEAEEELDNFIVVLKTIMQSFLSVIPNYDIRVEILKDLKENQLKVIALERDLRTKKDGEEKDG